MHRLLFRRFVLPSCLIFAVFSVSRVSAQLTITPSGAAQGLSLTTFASGFQNANNTGPLGITFPSGGVLVADQTGQVQLFPDIDGQNAATTPVAQNYGSANAVGLAQVAGQVYMAQATNGNLVQLNANGTFNRVIVSGFDHPVGVVADPLNGHLFVSDQFTRIYDVDPIAKTKTAFAEVPSDGLSLSPDGKTLYAAGENGHILGFNVSSGAQVFDSGPIPGGVDGTLVGAGDLFTGYIFANTNFGNLYEINLNDLSQTLLATNGSRGDFVSLDPSNDTLLVTQTDSIERLHGIPEPGTFMLGILFAGAPLLTRRRRVAARQG